MIRFSGNITNTEISNNLFVRDSNIDDVILWYKHWGGIWPDSTVWKGNIFYNQGTTNFLKLGETSNNSFTENILYGNEFADFKEFVPDLDKKDLKSKIKQVKKVGLRRNLSV